MNTNETLRFLRESEESNFVTLYNLNRNSYIPADNRKQVFLSDIPNEDLVQYIKSYIPETTENTQVYIEHRRKQGTTNRLVGKPYKIEVRPTIQQSVPAEAAPNTVPAHTVQMQAPPPPPPPIYNGLGNPGMVGLGVAEMVEMKVDSVRLADKISQVNKLEEELKESRQEIRDQRNDYERKINDYDFKLRKAEAELAVKDREKDIAIKEIEAAKKSFADSPLADKIFSSLEKISEVYMMKNSEAATGSSMLGLPDGLTETQQSFIEYIPNLSDDKINYLGSLLMYEKVPGFTEELKQLMQKHNGQEQNTNHNGQ